MNLEELRATVIGWLEELKSWDPSTGQSWSDYVLTEREFAKLQWPHRKAEDGREDTLVVLLFTDTHEYHICISTHKGRNPGMAAYAHVRKPRAGEYHTRGNNLPDGEFSKEMFDIIMHKILAYELVAKVKVSEPTVCSAVEAPV